MDPTLVTLIIRADQSTLDDIAASYKTLEDVNRWVKDCFRELGVIDANQCWEEQLFDLQQSERTNDKAMVKILSSACKQWQAIA